PSAPAVSRPVQAIEVEITVDTSRSPEMAQWAAQAKTVCEQQYAMLVSELGGADFAPPKSVRLIFEPRQGVAGPAGSTIYCSAEWFQRHPDDVGALIHELAHVVQAYGPKNNVPGWVTEGIADYMRWFLYEPATKRPKINPKKANYTDSYRTTAAFFDWI